MTEVDFSYLNEISDGNKTLLRSLHGHFKDTLERCINTLKTTSDKELWKVTCHELKGAALSIGATAVAEICAAEERYASLAITNIEDMEKSGYSSLLALQEYFEL